MKTLGITLAKGHSNGVPNKNIREIAGRPLLTWTVLEVQKSKRLSGYFVSTESPDVMGLMETTLRLSTCLWRPDELSRDDTTSLDVINFHTNYPHDFDAIALIPCTTPLRTAEDIDGAIQMLEDNPMADSVIGVTECIPVERVKKIVDGLIVDTYPEPQDGQRQNLEKCYTRSGIYVVRRDSLDKLFGHKTSLAYVIPPERGLNIDTPLDWEIAQMLLRRTHNLCKYCDSMEGDDCQCWNDE